MAKYETQNFTPSSTEDSAYAWDRLADGILGHVGVKTTQVRLREAFALLEKDDQRLLAHILNNLPARNTEHLMSAIDAVRRA